MQEGWDKPLWIAKLLKQNKQDIMDKLDSIENIFKKAGDATATDSDIVKPKTAYNGNTLLTGTLEDKTGTTSYTANITLDSTNKLLRMQVPSVGKYGVGNYLQQSFATIANLIGLTSAKLLKNNTVLGITGNSSNMDTSACDAAAAQILSGKKAGVKGNTVTGTMANKEGTTVKASAISQDEDNTYFTIPASGFYDTSSKIYTENSNLGSNRLLYVANLNASGLSTTDMFSTIATDPNDIITLSDKNIVINQSGSLKIVISGNGNVTSGNAAIKINGSLVLSVSGTSANNSKTINVSKGDIITGSCYAGSYGGYMNNRITMYYEP